MQRARLVYAFPILLAIGIVIIPVVADYGNHEMAAAAVEKSFRWAVGHLTAAAAFGLGVQASTLILSQMNTLEYRVPPFIYPLIAIGGSLYAAGLGIDGLGPIIMAAAGVPASAFFDASGWWVSGIFMAATASYGMGLISLSIHIIRAGMISGPWRYLIFVSALVFVAAPMIPSGWALYGVAAAAGGVFIPIGRRFLIS